MNYTGISEIGKGLVNLLRKEMVPDVLSTPDRIGLCSPEEHGDYEVGIYLYDIAESSEVRMNTMNTVNSTRMQNAPMALTLYYMVTAYSESDLPYRAEAEQLLLGKVIQVFYDHPTMSGFEDSASGYIPIIRMNGNMILDDKIKAWPAAGRGYKTSLYYKVGPVMIDSSVTIATSRVRESDLSVQEA